MSWFGNLFQGDMTRDSFSDLVDAHSGAASRWGAEHLGTPQERDDSWEAHTTDFPAADHSADNTSAWHAVSVPDELADADYLYPVENLIADGERYVADHPSAAWLDSTNHVADYEHDEEKAYAQEEAYANGDAYEAEL